MVFARSTREYYRRLEGGAVTSAAVIVPMLLSTFKATSVIDVGCGTGAWLREFNRHGISDYLGLDAAGVPRDLLLIPIDRFQVADLRRPPELGRGFDLACSLEVAEHLPAECAEPFVAYLARLAPLVIFSAAIPHQARGHVNERWQSYWCAIFMRHALLPIDLVRPAVYADERVDWWYRQNLLVYCRRELLPANMKPVLNPYQLNRVDPVMFEWLAESRHRIKGPPANKRRRAPAI